jgi:adenosylcobinamide-GDP ribazoletransferase
MSLRATDLWHDILAAFGLLTRLPLPFRALRAGGAWAWPLAGAGVGLIAATLAAGLLAAGLPSGLVAAAVLAAQMLLTGGLHEDGLADCADGFWGGQTRDRRLAIMKDSRIGSYGTLALIVTVLARWTALTLLVETPLLLVALGALSRAPMAALSAWLPNARGTGLSASVGRVGWAPAFAGAALALAIALPLAGGSAIPALIAAAGAGLAVGLVARAKIGGQTGDVLGASQQMAEVAVLAVLVA